MTAKTLEEEAREWIDKHIGTQGDPEEDVAMDAYLAAATLRDKVIEGLRARVKELEERIAMRTDLLEQAFSKNDDLSMRIRELEVAARQ